MQFRLGFIGDRCVSLKKRYALLSSRRKNSRTLSDTFDFEIGQQRILKITLFSLYSELNRRKKLGAETGQGLDERA